MSYHVAAGDPVASPAGDPEAAFSSVIGDSPSLREALSMAMRVGRRRPSTALIVGETGTGKELFARGIHAAGFEPGAPFVPVNCSSLPGPMLETELFGRERQAPALHDETKQGLLEVAGTGTLFLDEVSELPLDLQPKLLRVLEERRVRRIGGYDEVRVRCRITAATNRRLEDAVEEGRFREDLFYRLNVLRVTIPPLRKRRGDVVLLARHFLVELAESQGLPPIRVSGEAAEMLESHEWPGNVRELKNVLERAALVCEDGVLYPRDLTIDERARSRNGRGEDGRGSIAVPPEGRTLASIEAEAVRLTLERTGWNQSAAARILNVSRPTIARKIERYGLSPATRERGEP